MEIANVHLAACVQMTLTSYIQMKMHAGEFLMLRCQCIQQIFTYFYSISLKQV